MATKKDIGSLQAQLARLCSGLTASEIEVVLEYVRQLIIKRGN